MPTITTETDRLFHHHVLPVLTSDALFGFCLRMLRDRSAAEEIVQRTAVRAWERRYQLSDPEKARGWIFTIAHRQVVNFTIAEKRRRKLSAAALDPTCGDVHVPIYTGPAQLERGETINDVRAPAVDIEEQLDTVRSWEAVQAAMASLPEAYADTLCRRFMQDESTLEVAEAVGTARGTQLSRGFRARRMVLRRMPKVAEATCSWTPNRRRWPLGTVACALRVRTGQLWMLTCRAVREFDLCSGPRRPLASCTEDPSPRAKVA